MADDSYQNIREDSLLGPFIGCKLVDVTQHDADEFHERGSFVMLHFDNGGSVRFPIGDEGFDIESAHADT